MMGDTPEGVFPFDIVIVTSPDADAARVAPLDTLNVPTCSQVLSTSDPFDVRCGSGGGTLAALQQKDKTTLIVHAGGQSSRCPTQMVLGKAWTSLPAPSQNPTRLLIHSLARLLYNVPPGTLVVAASDVLLSLPENSQQPVDWEFYDVVGLAVPAPLETATNHGVYCFQTDVTSQKQDCVMPVERFLQKPTIQTLKTNTAYIQDHEASAWIDTGVVVFLPRAAATLYELSTGLLKNCTQQGLTELYNELSQKQQPLQDFCRQAAFKVDLYSHIMMALSTSTANSRRGMEAYLDKHRNDLPPHVLTGLYSTLSQYKLHVMVVPQGQFIHLGTTRELRNFLAFGVTRGVDDANGDDLQCRNQRRCQQFGRQIDMVRRFQAIILDSRVDPSCSVLNSLIQRYSGDSLQNSNDSHCIERGTVLEHISLVWTSLNVGSNCLVSGVRGRGPLEIPCDMCLQVLPLKKQKEEYVYMYFGVDDDIHGCNTLYGMTVKDVMHRSGLSSDEIWDLTESKPRTIWNAKLHPLVEHKDDQLQHQALFSWVTTLCRHPDLTLHHNSDAMTSLETWKCTRRLSLAEICKRADAAAEIRYRNHLSARIMHCAQIREILLNRQHKECDLSYVVDALAANTSETQEFWELVGVIDDVVRQSLRRAQYDVSSRALMVTSTLLSDLARVADKLEHNDDADRNMGNFPDEKNVWLEIDVLRSSTATDQERAMACDRIFSHRNRWLKEKHSTQTTAPSLSAFQYWSHILEDAARALTELCVSGSTVGALERYHERTRPVAPLDTWVVATSPVRIDLAGGWSDTPPLSYEYGGAVTSLAVTVDGHKPISSRCRKVLGGKGLLLRSESRDVNGKLVSQTKLRIYSVNELADYNNPRADCALIKCALVLLGLVPINPLSRRETEELQPYINRFCQSDDNVGMEVVSTSLLPHGSGMGTSSILGGCVLASVGKCVGSSCFGMDGSKDSDDTNSLLIQGVLMLEQLLSTGGGWQDQVGGLFGGLKLGTSEVHAIPLSVKVQHIPIDSQVRTQLNQRLVLAFTGKTRIAKNILQKVLRRWARRKADVLETVEELVTGAGAAADAVKEGNLDELGECVNSYWKHKKTMAGDESGVEPAAVQYVLEELLKRKAIVCGSLCGAGGGGFLMLLASAGMTGTQIQQIIRNELTESYNEVANFTWHECRVCQEGLSVRVDRVLDPNECPHDLCGPQA